MLVFGTVLAVVVGILGFSAVVANVLRNPFHAELEKREEVQSGTSWRNMQEASPVIDIYMRFLAPRFSQTRWPNVGGKSTTEQTLLTGG